MGDRHRIRFAKPEDLDALVELGRSTFAETFGHLYPPEDLADFLDEAHDAEIYGWAIHDDRHAVWLAEADGEPAGYALVGPCTLPHPEATPAEGELKRLYVRRSAQNGGLGRALLAVSMEWLQRNGPARLWVGVWSENHGAQRLYARHGFEPVGEYEFPVGRVRDREFILRREPVRLTA
jgi:ribosomal protein S18 acetylase RimI-like enzyme